MMIADVYSRSKHLFWPVILLIFLIGGGGALTPSYAKTTIAKSARLGGDGERVTFVTILSKKVPIKVFTLTNPYRVVIDLPEVKFQFPSGLGRKGKGLVSAYRYGLFARGKSRIVIDVKVPVFIQKAYVEGPKGNKPARMVIKLVKTSEAKFALSLSRRYLMKDLEPEKTKIKPPVIKTPSVKKPSKKNIYK